MEAAQQGVKVGDEIVPGLMFADDIVRISKTEEGPQEQIEKVLEYTREWRAIADGNICAVLVCNEDKKHQEDSK